MVKCLVTGGAGFIGSHLVDRLVKEKKNLIVIDNLSTGNIKNLKNVRKKIKFVNLDISKYSKKLENLFKGVDQVFHLAALADIVPSINDPIKYYKTNVTGTLNILSACKKNKVKKLIYASSSSCYGIPKKYPINEKAPIDTKYPYALTKYLAEELILHWAKVYKMKNISLRFFNTYGPRSRTSGAYGAVFGVFLAQKINKRPLTIVGDGNQTRDFLFITDLIDAIFKVSNKINKSSIFNVASGTETKVNRIAKIIGGQKIFIPERPGEPRRLKADIKKICTSINWKPKIDIDTGVQIMLRNINDWSEAPVWTKKKIKKETKNWFRYLK
jgi:UDP-glucose 4-epimerase